MNSAYPGYGRSRQVQVQPMLSAESVLWALRVGGRPTPDYVKAVFRSYIDIKFARGRTRYEIDSKLTLLERELPAYADEFRTVRLEKGLPASRLFGPTNAESLRRVQTSASAAANNRPSPGSLYRASTTSTSAARPSPSGITSVSRPTNTPARRPTTTTRPVVEDDEEPPPPPYARVDPEPDSTRLLQERLAAEAANTIPSGPPPGIATPPNEPVLVHPTTPPPASSTAAITPGRTSAATPPQPAGRAASTPPRLPSDPELRRIWEESQFDEAKRMSTVAERERLEMEEAMRLSLAETEAGGSGGGSENAAAGPSHPATAGAGNDSPGSRRASSYNPQTDLMGGRRTNDSDAGHAGGVEGLSTGIGNLDMSGGWDQQQSQHYLQPHQGQHQAAQPTGTSLLDDDDNDSVPLAATTLTPNKTGALMQSNNPFLSPSEREHAEAIEFPTSSSAGPSTPQPKSHGPSAQSYPSPHLSPPGGSTRDSPGTPRTTYNPPAGESPVSNKPLPSAPGPGGIQPRKPVSYAPPPGPPPAHLRIPTPPGQTDGAAVSTPIQPQQLERQYSSAQQPQQHAFASGQSAQHPSAQSQHQSSGPAPSTTMSQPPLPPRRETAQSTANQYAQGPAMISPISTEPPPGPPPIPLRPVQQDGEDPLEMLREYDTVFLIDDSASMAGERWDQAMNVIIGVAEIAAGYDEDGIDVYFFNSKRVGKELKTRLDVEDLFAGLTPRGSTPTGARLEAILRDYMSRLERSSMVSPVSEVTPASGVEVKPMNLIVVTDGAPSDDPGSVIISTAKRLDRGDYPLSQVGIQFFQIGNDPEAREALQELDDGLSEAHGVRDMVDTVPYTGEIDAAFIIKTLLGGVNRRQDRHGTL